MYVCMYVIYIYIYIYVCIYIYVYIYYTYIHIYIYMYRMTIICLRVFPRDIRIRQSLLLQRVTRLQGVFCWTGSFVTHGAVVWVENVELLAHTKALRCVYVFYTEVYIDVDTQLIQIHMHLTYTCICPCTFSSRFYRYAALRVYRDF